MMTSSLDNSATTRNQYRQEDNRSIAKAFEDCKTFLYYLDGGKGWDSCAPYCTEGASFASQCETLADIKTVEAYACWMQELTPSFEGFTRKVKHVGFCEENRTVSYVASLHGKGKQGQQTDKEVKEFTSAYTYLVTLSQDDGKVERVEKIWNDFYALKQAGWIAATKKTEQGHYYD
jgi:hypothetical protein